ncbi:MAG: glycosyltransferase family 2 protein [Myxococcales bacterium]|nr:glycosyltransferase family 2 protein [Myxococcales bacterium]MCB9519975.1 glycosyltransferase family 2 protein [Myxococcales bacterium]MCB9533114.1 glycosyltransferase family 2 protein [Myxococcales bacterium]
MQEVAAQPPHLSSASDLAGSPGGVPSVSIVIAIYNERDSLHALADEIRGAMDQLPNAWEAVMVDDGSSDGSRQIEREIHAADPRFKVIQLRRNFGKAAAMSTGFRAAQGEIVVTMDADLQDDPSGITDLIRPIEDGSADLVSGWKFPRRDPLGKRLPSKLYNFVTRVASGVDLHDMNCGFKAYRAEVVREVALYGEMHRYIPVMAAGAGFKVTEAKVHHRPRVHGQSKYAYARFIRGFLDLLTVVFLTRYRRRPLHLIGGLGLGMGSLGFLILLYLTASWFLGNPLANRPLLFLGMLLVLVAGQFFTFGLLAEMMTYYDARDRNEYPQLARLGFHDDPAP